MREKLAGPVYELVFELWSGSWARALRSHYVRSAGSWGCAWPCLTHDRGESRGWSLPPSQGSSGPRGSEQPCQCGCPSATLAGEIKERGVPCRGPSPCDGRSHSVAVSRGDCLIPLACSHRGTRSHTQCGPCAPWGICRYLLVAWLLLLLSWLLLRAAQPRGWRLISIQSQALPRCLNLPARLRRLRAPRCLQILPALTARSPAWRGAGAKHWCRVWGAGQGRIPRRKSRQGFPSHLLLGRCPQGELWVRTMAPVVPLPCQGTPRSHHPSRCVGSWPRCGGERRGRVGWKAKLCQLSHPHLHQSRLGRGAAPGMQFGWGRGHTEGAGRTSSGCTRTQLPFHWEGMSFSSLMANRIPAHPPLCR